MTAPIYKQCPICSSYKNETIHIIDCGNIDNSELYSTVYLKVCNSCGHIFNSITENELIGLNHYYNDEYAPANINSTDIKGDRPGSASKFTFDRYCQLYETIEPFLSPEFKILDLGCAMGGFLDFLYEKGYHNLYGVDPTKEYVAKANDKNKYKLKLGDAGNIPFDDNSFDIVIMEQVLEHVSNPVQVFKEVKRVLTDNGIFCIGVPDASRYSDFAFFDYYWIILREHIQHFDDNHIKYLAESEKYELVKTRKTKHFVMAEKMVMPNLYSVLRSVSKNNLTDSKFTSAFELKTKIQGYIEQEDRKIQIKKKQIEQIAESNRPVYVWGIGREFLFLYKNTELKSCNIAALIDKNALKKKSYSVDGIRISDENVLKEATQDSVLVITAFAHVESIEQAALDLGYKGEVLEFEKENAFSG